MKTARHPAASELPYRLTRSSREDEKWANQMRNVVVMFANLGLSDRDLLDAGRYANMS